MTIYRIKIVRFDSVCNDANQTHGLIARNEFGSICSETLLSFGIEMTERVLFSSRTGGDVTPFDFTSYKKVFLDSGQLICGFFPNIFWKEGTPEKKEGSFMGLLIILRRCS